MIWFNWLDYFGAKISLSVGRGERLYLAGVA